MGQRQRIVNGQAVKGGGTPVTSSSPPLEKVPGAVLSAESAELLRSELWDIDEAQHAALAAGDQYYLGPRL